MAQTAPAFPTERPTERQASASAAAEVVTGTVLPLAQDAVRDASPHGPAPARSVLRGAVALLSTQPLTWLASLLVAMLVPRYLGAEALGQYSVAMTIGALMATVASLGVFDYLPRRIATYPERGAVDATAALAVTVGLGIVLALALGLVLPAAVLPVPSPVFGLVLVGIVFSLVQRHLLAVLRGQERYSRFAWLVAASTIAGAAASIGALAAGGGLTAYVAALASVSAVSALAIWRLSGFRLQRGGWDYRLAWSVACSGLPFLAWNLSLQLYGEIDRLFLVAFASDAVVGWYAAAYRIIAIPIFIPTLVTMPLLPALSRSLADRHAFQTTLHQSVVAVLVLTVPFSALIAAAAPAVPDLLGWPATFEGSVPLMMILAPHIPLLGVNMVLGTALLALHQERRWLCVALVAAVFNPALNVALIPVLERTLHNGAIAAAAVTVATELVMFGGALVLLAPRGLVERSLFWMAGRVLVAAVPLVLAVVALWPVSPVLALVTAGAAYLGASFLLGTIRTADLRLVQREAQRLLRRVR